jgi:hypothetical protein
LNKFRGESERRDSGQFGLPAGFSPGFKEAMNPKFRSGVQPIACVSEAVLYKIVLLMTNYYSYVIYGGVGRVSFPIYNPLEYNRYYAYFNDVRSWHICCTRLRIGVAV